MVELRELKKKVNRFNTDHGIKGGLPQSKLNSGLKDITSPLESLSSDLQTFSDPIDFVKKHIKDTAAMRKLKLQTPYSAKHFSKSECKTSLDYPPDLLRLSMFSGMTGESAALDSPVLDSIGISRSPAFTKDLMQSFGLSATARKDGKAKYPTTKFKTTSSGYGLPPSPVLKAKQPRTSTKKNSARQPSSISSPSAQRPLYGHRTTSQSSNYNNNHNGRPVGERIIEVLHDQLSDLSNSNQQYRSRILTMESEISTLAEKCNKLQLTYSAQNQKYKTQIVSLQLQLHATKVDMEKRERQVRKYYRSRIRDLEFDLYKTKLHAKASTTKLTEVVSELTEEKEKLERQSKAGREMHLMNMLKDFKTFQESVEKQRRSEKDKVEMIKIKKLGKDGQSVVKQHLKELVEKFVNAAEAA